MMHTYTDYQFNHDPKWFRCSTCTLVGTKKFLNKWPCIPGRYEVKEFEETPNQS